jgi:hypothetical protein
MAVFSPLSHQTINLMPERKPENERIPLIFYLQ